MGGITEGRGSMEATVAAGGVGVVIWAGICVGAFWEGITFE
jgi:hypothetical protein